MKYLLFLRVKDLNTLNDTILREVWKMPATDAAAIMECCGECDCCWTCWGAALCALAGILASAGTEDPVIIDDGVEENGK